MRQTSTGSPLISVIIPTFNRVELLEPCLSSLAQQTLPLEKFEVVVVDDGSTDGTRSFCKHAAASIPLRYVRIANSGISAAKNAGLFTSRAPICLFFDDDDLADAFLLEAHLEAHREHQQESRAVLGYTAWSPAIDVTPVMSFVTDIGMQLFSFRDLQDGQLLDYTYFWGGRSSCKRAFLARHGIFNQDFRTIIEDIELAYRLSKFGLDVVYSRSAVSYMARPITFDGMCERCERKGAALWRFSRLHEDPNVAAYCRIREAAVITSDFETDLRRDCERVRALELDPAVASAELFDLYQRCFDVSVLKGIRRAADADHRDLAREVASWSREETSPPVPVAPFAGSTRHREVCERPVFIVGSPRSGTSILAWSLNEHTEFQAFAESEFLYPLFAEHDHLTTIYDLCRARPDGTFLLQEQVSWEEFLEHIGYGINRLFASRTAGRRWIDQSPLYTAMLDTLVHMFPDSQYIHILRDGRRVAHSMMYFANAFADRGFGDIVAAERAPTWAHEITNACRTWSDYTRIAADFGEAYPGRLVTVRNEDIIHEGEDAFRTILDFLGVHYEPGPAAFCATYRVNSSFGPDYSPPPSLDDKPWEEWPEEWSAVFAEEAGESMVKAGYWSAEECDETRARHFGARLK